MLELNVTKYVDLHDCGEYSGSIAELGDNAGRITWNNAMSEVADNPLVTSREDIETCRDYFGEFGAWDDDERAAWTDSEVNALLLQFIAGDIRELEGCDSIDEYNKGAVEGRYSGRLYRGDDMEWYFYVGN